MRKPFLNVYQLTEALRALLVVFEVGPINAEQRRMIHKVRLLLGDAEGSDCRHEHIAYEDDKRTGITDILICQDCRGVLTA